VAVVAWADPVVVVEQVARAAAVVVLVAPAADRPAAPADQVDRPAVHRVARQADLPAIAKN
jgi:hypothetical protein